MIQSKHDEYNDVREAYFHALSLRLVQTSGIQVTLGPIEGPSLAQTLEWENRLYPWNWFEFKRKFRNIPARFELSIRVHEQVCGLAIGKPSRGRRHLAIYFIEGNPDKQHPLRGQLLPILLEAASLYGVALGCAYLRLINPVEGLHPLYSRWGFEFDKEISGRIYCERKLVGGDYGSS